MIVFNDLIGQWVFEKTGGTWEGSGRAIGLEKDGKIIAGVAYDSYTGSSICIHIAIEGRITRSFIYAIFAYPFLQLKVQKLIGPVSSANKKAIRLDRHAGFIEEGVIKDAYRDGDMILFTMTPKQCRFLGSNNGKKF